MKVNRFDYFKNLMDLLDSEKFEDKLQFEISTEVSSIAEKVADGKCWYPCFVSSILSWNKSEYILNLKRTYMGDTKSAFQLGNSVRIFNNKLYETENYSIQGKITWVGEKEMKVSIDAKAYKQYEDRDSWLNKDDLAVEQTYNRKGYIKMMKALRKLQNKPQGLAERLSDILIGNTAPTRTSESEPSRKYNFSLLEKLNEWQQKAILDLLETDDVSLVLGPPGTGKTTTTVHAIKILVDAGLGDEKILVTAPSNTAVDLLATKLHEMGGINVLRLGNAEKINKEASALTLAGKIESHPDFLLLNNISKKIQSRFEHLRSQPRDKEELLRRNEEDSKARNRIYKMITREVFQKAQVIACTLEGTVAQELKKYYKSKFAYAFIDEAGQALEPLSWLPVLRSRKVVMIGDHHQLPPVVKSVEIYEGVLRKSLFEKAMKNGNIPHLILSLQYRMHEKIMNFSNHYFYGGQLRAADANRYHTLAKVPLHHDWNRPFQFIDTCHCNFIEQKVKAISSSSTINREEGEFLVRHLENFVLQIEAHGDVVNIPALTIGIITPYRQQLYLLEELIKASDILQNFKGKLSSNTVDGYQGQEQDVIYLSLVRSNESQTIGFLKEYRRMNVAITRAKKKVVIIGDSRTLQADDFYSQLIKYARHEKFYSLACVAKEEDNLALSGVMEG